MEPGNEALQWAAVVFCLPLSLDLDNDRKSQQHYLNYEFSDARGEFSDAQGYPLYTVPPLTLSFTTQ